MLVFKQLFTFLNRAVILANKSWSLCRPNVYRPNDVRPKDVALDGTKFYVSNKTDFKALNNFQGRTFLELSRSETNAVTLFYGRNLRL